MSVYEEIINGTYKKRNQTVYESIVNGTYKKRSQTSENYSNTNTAKTRFNTITNNTFSKWKYHRTKKKCRCKRSSKGNE